MVLDELGLKEGGGLEFGGGEPGVPGRGGHLLPALGRDRSSSPWRRVLEGLGAPGLGARVGRGLTLLSRAPCWELSWLSQHCSRRKAFIFSVLLGWLH